MQPLHLLLALLVVVTWGVNFVIMKIGLHGFPPLFLCALRFLMVSIPAIFFFPRPRASWRLIAGYGLATFACQFGFMFTGIAIGMPPGLASLVLQTQAFFTMGLAALVFGERPGIWKIVGALVSFVGIFIVGYNAQATAILSGFILTLLAAVSWASGNTVSKKIAPSSALALVIWGSLVAFPPMLLLSLIVEASAIIMTSFANLEWATVGAVSYLVFLSTHFGYSVWGYLLNKYPSATIAPFSLLIPVFGFLSSAVFLGEELPIWKIGASLLVIAGLCLNVFESRIRRSFAQRT